MTIEIHETCLQHYADTIEFAKKVGLYEVPRIKIHGWAAVCHARHDEEGGLTPVHYTFDGITTDYMVPAAVAAEHLRRIDDIRRLKEIGIETIEQRDCYWLEIDDPKFQNNTMCFLKKSLDYLDKYADPERKGLTKCTLYKDFAPYSFEFKIEYLEGKPGDGKGGPRYAHMMNGGLIYHGKHDHGGDGSGPTFSVNLQPVDGWAIHT